MTSERCVKCEQHLFLNDTNSPPSWHDVGGTEHTETFCLIHQTIVLRRKIADLRNQVFSLKKALKPFFDDTESLPPIVADDTHRDDFDMSSSVNAFHHGVVFVTFDDFHRAKAAIDEYELQKRTLALSDVL